MLRSKRIVKCCFMFISLFAIMLLFTSSKIGATYGTCDKKLTDTELYDCGGSIYTYYEDREHSSVIKALNGDSVLYAGKVEGIDIFYVNGFEFYNVTYDDRSFNNNNIWTTVTSRGKIIFDGSFNDSWLVDESHSGRYIDFLFKEVYTIRQYINDGELYRTLVLYNYHDGNIEFTNASYDGASISSEITNEVLDSKEEFSVKMDSIYGVKSAEVSINGNEIESRLENNIVSVSSGVLKNNLIKGEVNTINISVKDYFSKKASIKYKLLLVNNEVLIEFSTMTSIVESASRRIRINAIAGKGKKLDTDYCWYYWSKSPDDGLDYEEFLKNYANSSYKGSYSEDKGVILRNTSGTYYLYALAKDEDTFVVKRSEGYILNGEGYKVTYNVYDWIFVVAIAILGVIPISIYLYIRKKGY